VPEWQQRTPNFYPTYPPPRVAFATSIILLLFRALCKFIKFQESIETKCEVLFNCIQMTDIHGWYSNINETVEVCWRAVVWAPFSISARSLYINTLPNPSPSTRLTTHTQLYRRALSSARSTPWARTAQPNNTLYVQLVSKSPYDNVTLVGNLSARENIIRNNSECRREPVISSNSVANQRTNRRPYCKKKHWFHEYKNLKT